jgi:4-hydroxy 2-oxovalerate aldolase
MDKIINIDCTLRDGGYYNKWDFSIEFINEYLRIMALISIDYVEIGFRSLDDKFYKGPCAYSTEGLFEILEIPLGLQIGVMINADEAIAFEDGQEVFINKLFEDASSSAISLVRVAVNFKDVDKVSAIFNALKKRGYKTCINLMQIADRTSEELEFSIKYAKSYGVDVFYIADSFGSLFPESIARILKHIKIYWQGPIGIHAHDNLTFALCNTLTAIDCGVNWVDSTVLGMGRGPGNVKTELKRVKEIKQL